MLTRSTGISPISGCSPVGTPIRTIATTRRRCTPTPAGVAAAVAIAVCLQTLPAAAQAPLPLPNQRDVDRVLNPRLPQYENPLDKRIKRGLDSIGLPPQPSPEAPAEFEQAPSPEPGLSSTELPRLDANRDGFVSRDEYFTDRQRAATAGSQGTQRHVERYRRLDSRFRAADRNRDGRLSPDEIDNMEGRRF